MSIKFPPSTDSGKWQTAYTADDAYYDTEAISPNASLISLMSLMLLLAFINWHGTIFVFGENPTRRFLFSIDPGFAKSLGAGQLSEPISVAFAYYGRPLSSDTTAAVEVDGNAWVINDKEIQYFIINEQQELKVYEKRDLTEILGITAIITIMVCVVYITLRKSAFHHTRKFFLRFYLPPRNIDPTEIIKYRRSKRIKLPMPFSEWFPGISQFKYLLVKNGEFLNKNDWPAWLAQNIGGPLLLIVYDGSALYLERGNRFSRVVGPGASFLERHETIKYAVDLRTKTKTGIIKVWTKDGIKTTLTIQTQYRIGDPCKISTKPLLIYPFDPLAVKQAIERHSLRWPASDKEPVEFTWEDAAWGQVTGIVPDYIGSRFLDDLLVADRQGGQILAPDATSKIFEALNNATTSFGVHIIDFQILSIELPPEVKEFYLKYWEAERQSLATIMDGKAKAFNIRTQEKVKADAQHDLILAIADGLKKNKDGRLTEALILSLSEILDHGLNDPYMRSYTAKETLETLEKIQALLEQPERKENHDPHSEDTDRVA